MRVDADAHVIETELLFADYLEGSLRQRRPRLVQLREDVYSWYVDGEMWPRQEGLNPSVPAGMHPGAAKSRGREEDTDLGNPALRLQHMAEGKVDIQVIFPSLMMAACYFQDRDLAVGMCQAYNTWVTERCRPHADRLRPVAVVPLQEPVEAVRELRRAILDLGMAGVMIPGNLRDKTLDHPDLFPVFEEADRLGTVMAVHANLPFFDQMGAGRFQWYWYNHVNSMAYNVMVGMTSVVGGGLLERLPNIKFAFLEAGAGWIPYWAWRMDEHFEKREFYIDQSARRLGRVEVPYLKHKPSVYLRSERCFWSAEGDEPGLDTLVRTLGDHQVLYASDYPHGDHNFPHSLHELLERADLSEKTKEKILDKNPARCFQLAPAKAAAAVGAFN